MKRVLFLGNSFTFFQDLPEIVRNLAEGAGVYLNVRSITKGGASLREFLNPENKIGAELQEALQEEWDYVVFQEQSFRPVGNPKAFHSAVDELSALFPHSIKLFYQTWAYRDGSEKLASKEISYLDMYQGLKSAYTAASERNAGDVVPVGDGFYRIWKDGSRIDLYRPDDYHPSPAGTYLAACLFVGKILNMSPCHLPDALGLDSDTAGYLRKVASDLL